MAMTSSGLANLVPLLMPEKRCGPTQLARKDGLLPCALSSDAWKKVVVWLNNPNCSSSKLTLPARSCSSLVNKSLSSLCLQCHIQLYHFQPLCLPSGSVIMSKEHQSQSAPGQGSHTPNLSAPLKHAAPDTSAHNRNENNPCEALSLIRSGTLRHAGTGNVCVFLTT